MASNIVTRKGIAEILSVFMNAGVDAIMGGPDPVMHDAVSDAQDRTGRAAKLIFTPAFNITPNGPRENEPERVFDTCKDMGATFCLPHQSVTDRLIDRMANTIRDIDKYTAMIRARGMIPGLSTHMPEAVTIADATGADVETYVQLTTPPVFSCRLKRIG